VDVHGLTRRIAYAAALALAPVASAMACTPDAFLGSVCVTAGNRCPKDTLPADGQLMPVAGNAALFNLLGNTYGGDGSTTFALPDLRGRVVVNRGQGRDLADREVGQQFGTLALQLTEANLPSHNHAASSEAQVTLTLRAVQAPGESADPAGRAFASLKNVSPATPTTTYGYSELPADVDMDVSAIRASASVTTTLGPAGGGQPLPYGNAQPTLAMTYCIVVNGIFPNYSEGRAAP